MNETEVEEDGHGGKGDTRPFVDVVVGKTREIAGRICVIQLKDAGSVSLGSSKIED